MKPSLLVILVLIGASVLSGCMSTRKVQSAIDVFDQSVFHREDTLSTPKGIRISVDRGLPEKSTAKKKMFVILPLIAVNIIQSVYQVQVGQSSFERFPGYNFRKEFIRKISSCDACLELFQQKALSLNIYFQATELRGTFSSGVGNFYSQGGSLKAVTHMRAKIDISFQLVQNDSLLISRSFSLIFKSGHGTKSRIIYASSNPKSRAFLPDNDQALPMTRGKTPEDLIDNTKMALECSEERAAEIISTTIKNYVNDFLANNK
jgi:hypothetical protein